MSLAPRDPEDDKPWLKEHKLIIADKKDIQEGRMLHTSHVNVVHKMARALRPNLGGLQRPVISQAAGFEYVPDEGLQINQFDTHFALSTQLGLPAIVSVFDSFFDSPGRNFRKQLLDLFKRPEDKFLLVRWMNYQKQPNGRDCALYAIAALCELLSGRDAVDVANTSFDPGQLRPHLIRVVEEGKLTPFPKAAEPQPRVVPEIKWFVLTDDGRKGPFDNQDAARAAANDDLQGTFAESRVGRVSRPSAKKFAAVFGSASTVKKAKSTSMAKQSAPGKSTSNKPAVDMDTD